MTDGFSINDALIILAAFLGPFFGIYAQKKIEARRAERDRKYSILEALMRTRAATLTDVHVQALNSIDLTYYGGGVKRSKQEQLVIDRWREYLGHLDCDLSKFSDNQRENWQNTSKDLLVSLLEAMAVEGGYKFDRALIKKGVYMPVAHEVNFSKQLQIRDSVLNLLNGEASLKVSIKGLDEQ